MIILDHNYVNPHIRTCINYMRGFVKKKSFHSSQVSKNNVKHYSIFQRHSSYLHKLKPVRIITLPMGTRKLDAIEIPRKNIIRGIRRCYTNDIIFVTRIKGRKRWAKITVPKVPVPLMTAAEYSSALTGYPDILLSDWYSSSRSASFPSRLTNFLYHLHR